MKAEASKKKRGQNIEVPLNLGDSQTSLFIDEAEMNTLIRQAGDRGLSLRRYVSIILHDYAIGNLKRDE